MNFYEGIPFFVTLVIALIPAVILGVCERRTKYYTLFLSACFIVLIYGGDMRQMAFLLLFYLFELHVVKIYLWLRNKYGRNGILYGHFVLAAIAPLVAYKCLDLVSVNLFGFLGISYLTFKVVQIIIETYDGIIKEIRVSDFTSFLLFFPTLSSGPIDRSRRFQEDLNQVRPRGEYIELLGEGIKKLLFGAAYKFVLSAIFYEIMNNFSQRYLPQYVLGYAYSYGLYLFFDFAGYSLMAIGTSYILGIRTPDNFRFPFLSTDLKDFWNRWHITLSHWFRDFIFTRFLMNAIRKKWFSSRLNAASVGFVINMTIMGLWHGFTSYYIVYGIYHGLLLALTEWYQKKSKFYQKHKNSKVYRGVSWFVTLNLVMFGFLIFSGHLNEVASVVLHALVQ